MGWSSVDALRWVWDKKMRFLIAPSSSSSSTRRSRRTHDCRVRRLRSLQARRAKKYGIHTDDVMSRNWWPVVSGFLLYPSPAQPHLRCRNCVAKVCANRISDAVDCFCENGCARSSDECCLVRAQLLVCAKVSEVLWPIVAAEVGGLILCPCNVGPRVCAAVVVNLKWAIRCCCGEGTKTWEIAVIINW